MWENAKKSPPQHDDKIDVLVKYYNPKKDEFVYDRIIDIRYNAYGKTHHEKWLHVPDDAHVVGWMHRPAVSAECDPTRGGD